jgi:hypothetical protein
MESTKRFGNMDDETRRQFLFQGLFAFSIGAAEPSHFARSRFARIVSILPFQEI